MTQVGRKIYYELSTGKILVDKGEYSGNVRETTEQEDYATYTALAERVPSTVGMIQLEFGQYDQDFAECNGYYVNLATGLLEFSYPDPSVPTTPPVYQAPLTTQVEELKSQNADIIFALVSNNLM